MGALTKGLVLAAFLGALLTPPPAASPGDTADPGEVVSTLQGQGVRDGLACFGCTITLIGVAGGTWGGMIVLGFFYGDAIAACAYICYGALRE